MLRALNLWMREFSDGMRFFAPENKAHRQLVFYSERDIYYKYFEGLIDYILKNSDLTFSYLTSDENDPIFSFPNERVKRFYVKNSLAALLLRLDSKIVVMTMPDLNQSFIKKPETDVEFLYKFHAMVSSHLQFKKGAFDHFDTVCCVGPHHVREIRKTEEVYGLPPKKLIESGYHVTEKLYHIYRQYKEKNPGENERPYILIAPTWGPGCLLETCIEELMLILAKTPYTICLRPHPEFMKRKPAEFERITEMTRRHENIKLETRLTTDESILKADVLITDRSGICYEYACATERPVLFIETPLKIQNPEYQTIAIEPVEITTRTEVGLCVALDQLATVPEKLAELMENGERYRQKIIQCREKLLFNWLDSSRVEGEYVIARLKESNEPR